MKRHKERRKTEKEKDKERYEDQKKLKRIMIEFFVCF